MCAFHGHPPVDTVPVGRAKAIVGEIADYDSQMPGGNLSADDSDAQCWSSGAQDAFDLSCPAIRLLVLRFRAQVDLFGRPGSRCPCRHPVFALDAMHESLSRLLPLRKSDDAPECSTHHPTIDGMHYISHSGVGTLPAAPSPLFSIIPLSNLTCSPQSAHEKHSIFPASEPVRRNTIGHLKIPLRSVVFPIPVVSELFQQGLGHPFHACMNRKAPRRSMTIFLWTCIIIPVFPFSPMTRRRFMSWIS
jgi:hypothetical protein